MHIFLVDETNKNFEPGHFFIVGGLVIRPEQVEAVHSSVGKHSSAAGFRPGDSFKFSTSERPSYISPQAHREAKTKVIADLRDIGVRMIATVVLHDLARNKGYDEQMNYSLNTIAGAYHKLLYHEDSHGVMLIDRDNDRYNHLEHLFQHGLKFSDGDQKDLSDRIRLFGQTSDNASTLSSAADIALGSFRYCVNVASGQGREEVAHSIFGDLSQIFWRNHDPSGILRIRDFGYHPRPRIDNVRSTRHRERYEQLSSALSAYSMNPMAK